MVADRPGEAALAELRGVGFRAGGRRIIEGVDLRVRRGEIVTLIGPNGSGKSTVTRILLGLLKPSEGVVQRAAGLRVGYMPQNLALDPVLPLTVGGFLGLARRTSRDDQIRALDEVGAARLLSSQMGNLSGGERQRVLLARALLRDPDLLVLDEPVQGVDINGQAELYELIGGVRRRHDCGVLLVSHDLHFVMAATDYVICLNHHVCCAGQPEAVSRDPAYVELFGARLADNVALYTHHHDHRHDVAGEIVEPGGEGCSHDPG